VSLSMNIQYDNNRLGWLHNDSIHPLSVDKHSGKIQVFGAFTVFGKLCIKTFHGNMDSAMYRDIVRQDLILNASKLFPYGWVFVQDNSSTHKADALLLLSVCYYEVPYKLTWPVRKPD